MRYFANARNDQSLLAVVNNMCSSTLRAPQDTQPVVGPVGYSRMHGQTDAAVPSVALAYGSCLAAPEVIVMSPFRPLALTLECDWQCSGS